MAAPAVLTGVLADLSVPRRGLRRAQYEALVDAGLLDGDPVELPEGVLTEVVPQSAPHARSVRRLDRWLQRVLPEEWTVLVQAPLAATDDSEPEPDVAVVREPEQGHPTTAAGVGQYWVVDLGTREVVVHTGPVVDGGGARYEQVGRAP